MAPGRCQSRREIGDEDEESAEDPERWLWVGCKGSTRAIATWSCSSRPSPIPSGLIAWASRSTVTGAFRRFKDVLGRWPGEIERWYAFCEERQRGRARAWLAGPATAWSRLCDHGQRTETCSDRRHLELLAATGVELDEITIQLHLWRGNVRTILSDSARLGLPDRSVMGEHDSSGVEGLEALDPVRYRWKVTAMTVVGGTRRERGRARTLSHVSWLWPAMITVPSARRTTTDWWPAVCPGVGTTNTPRRISASPSRSS